MNNSMIPCHDATGNASIKTIYSLNKTHFNDGNFVSHSNETYSPAQTHRVRKRKYDNIPDLNDELMHAYKMLKDILSNPANKIVLSSYLEDVDRSDEFYKDYDNMIKNPIWLNKINKKLLAGQYSSLPEVIHDLRVMLENAYRYHGPSHHVSKRGAKLETMIDQKLALLPKALKEATSLEATNPDLAVELEYGERRQMMDSIEGSRIMNSVLSERDFALSGHDKSLKRGPPVQSRLSRKAREISAQEWEETLMKEEGKDMKAMWEIPQISIFFFLAFRILNIVEIPHYIIERFLLIPQASSQLAWLMMSLLSNFHQRSVLHQKRLLPYKKWNELVKIRVQNWYKMLRNKHTAKEMAALEDQIGVSPHFFYIMGSKNPLMNKDFHELTFHQRVWVLKSLCDNCFNNQKLIQEAVLEKCGYLRCDTVLGEDRDKYEYIYFPQFCGDDLRIYKQLKGEAIDPYAEPCPEDLAPNPEKFYLVVDSIESLRSLIIEIESREPLVPVNDEEEEPFDLELPFVSSKKKKKKLSIPLLPPSPKTPETPLCEVELLKNLNEVLADLQKWEAKLEGALKQNRLSLKREWDAFLERKAKEEEEAGAQELPSGDEFKIEDDDDHLSAISDHASSDISNFSNTTPSRKRTNQIIDKNHNYDLDDDPFEISVSSRGRIRKIKKLYERKPRVSTPSDSFFEEMDAPGTESDGASHSQEWETWRQIVSVQNTKDISNQVNSRNFCPTPSDDLSWGSFSDDNWSNDSQDFKPSKRCGVSQRHSSSTASASSNEDMSPPLFKVTPSEGYSGRQIFIQCYNGKPNVEFKEKITEEFTCTTENPPPSILITKGNPVNGFQSVISIKKVANINQMVSSQNNIRNTSTIQNNGLKLNSENNKRSSPASSITSSNKVTANIVKLHGTLNNPTSSSSPKKSPNIILLSKQNPS